ncbi:hypothetical protein DKP76_02235 [Falsochrobactrum shanghaiense]|uniref:Uncharacterized protein n=1 Tax=Falsochrobactrum shanghaiense TaxID=2201899 RepID=A0A316JW74_9HYPH|nr:hypothetical protein [Falsochrobactrum shanghaiense]PWL19390.1 hypothetical protein DKP76_02235 [Falsochrobactrum shanghaiense]
MTKTSQEGDGARYSLGRRLLFLTILAVLLACALVTMSIYLFDADGSLDLEDFGVFVYKINAMDTTLPRIL